MATIKSGIGTFDKFLKAAHWTKIRHLNRLQLEEIIPGFFKNMTQPSITRPRHKTELISADIVTYRDNTSERRNCSHMKK